MVGVDRVIPTRTVTARNRDNGNLELLVPRFKGFWLGWLQRRLPSHRAHQRVVLDALGSRVWLAMDGEADVGQIAKTLVEAGDVEAQDLVSRVWMFVRAMASEGWVELKTPAI